ncbi:GNAT family N-acetyltransferase [Paenibacillus crassostreae]|uniref:GNAT family acetyltransferase n=1 Tax=Paenibacillus crassostreae TaxID=1763538 RepID=A0A167FHS0_9BACL|nr:GNAT family N-acetyltransferase [Paenibacillus crassostreae]AOZ94391.1 GNAT family N-acetyltransferase [Paenibacillus crassostreae]OAB76572.1 GNAT family acetyltransferase [Paenibacillus crassostreae]
MNPAIDIIYEAPLPEEYNELRVKAGLSAKDIAGASIALGNSIFCIILRQSNDLIGMGRIIGDGGCFYHIVDIAVDPSYQGKGLGKLLMAEITQFLDENAFKDSYVSLIADSPADQLYKKFGFEYTYPKSVGMYKKY